MTPDELREIISVGDWVRYDTPGFSFEGTVVAVDFERDLVRVRMCDQWGQRDYLCGMERLVHLLGASAMELKAPAEASA